MIKCCGSQDGNGADKVSRLEADKALRFNGLKVECRNFSILRVPNEYILCACCSYPIVIPLGPHAQQL